MPASHSDKPTTASLAKHLKQKASMTSKGKPATAKRAKSIRTMSAKIERMEKAMKSMSVKIQTMEKAHAVRNTAVSKKMDTTYKLVRSAHKTLVEQGCSSVDHLASFVNHLQTSSDMINAYGSKFDELDARIKDLKLRETGKDPFEDQGCVEKRAVVQRDTEQRTMEEDDVEAYVDRDADHVVRRVTASLQTVNKHLDKLQEVKDNARATFESAFAANWTLDSS